MVQARKAKRNVLVAAFNAYGAHWCGIARYARENGWHLITDMLFTGTFPHGWNGDGILAIAGCRPDLMIEIRASGHPCVVIAGADESTHFPRVEEDHVQIGRTAAEHLLARAYRSFAWAPLANDKPDREQLRGFRSRLAEAGCNCRILPEAYARIGLQWQCNGMDYRHRLAAEIRQLPRPTAIFCFNDSVAAGLIDTCRDNGASVPEEFAILGVGNDPLVCESDAVPLSSVEPDHEQIGYRAAEALDSLMNGEATPQQVIRVPPKGVITRVSTDVKAVADPHIARALSFIAENYCDPMLSVLDVATAVGVSRRHLERSFHCEIGCTISAYMTGIRMQEASQLLRMHPQAKSSAVAALVGIADAGTFYRTFRRHFGMSPKAHRDGVAQTYGTKRISSPDLPLKLERLE